MKRVLGLAVSGLLLLGAGTVWAQDTSTYGSSSGDSWQQQGTLSQPGQGSQAGSAQGQWTSPQSQGTTGSYGAQGGYGGQQYGAQVGGGQRYGAQVGGGQQGMQNCVPAAQQGMQGCVNCPQHKMGAMGTGSQQQLGQAGGQQQFGQAGGQQQFGQAGGQQQFGQAGAGQQGFAQGVVQRLQYDHGIVQLQSGDELLTLRATPSQVSALKAGDNIAFNYSKFGKQKWLQSFQQQGQNVPQQGGNLFGTVASLNRSNGSLTLTTEQGKRQLMAHPMDIQQLAPGQSVSLTYEHIGTTDWASNITPQGGQQQQQQQQNPSQYQPQSQQKTQDEEQENP